MSKQQELVLGEIDKLIGRMEGEVAWHTSEMRFAEDVEKSMLQQYRQALMYSLSELKNLRKTIESQTHE